MGHSRHCERTDRLIIPVLLISIALLVCGGCRLVDGEDSGATLALNSMAVSADCKPQAHVAEPYSCAPKVSIAEDVEVTHISWELTSTHTCDWLRINPSTGQVFGMPELNHLGDCVLAFRVKTPEEPSDDFALRIAALGPKITIEDNNCLTTAAVDKLYECDFNASSKVNNDQLLWSLAPENSCSWAQVESVSGVVTGSPSLSDTGSCDLVLKVSLEGLSSEVVRMKILVPKIEVVVSQNCNVEAEAGVPYSCTPSASAPIRNASYQWSLSSRNSCDWARINVTSGQISGSPEIYESGSCRLDMTAKLSDGSLGQASLTLDVKPKGYRESQLVDSSGKRDDGIGQSVDVDGDWAVVGAPEVENGNGSTGAVIVYRFDGSLWRQEVRLTPSSSSKVNLFGYSVAISGNTILVGAPDSSASSLKVGAVFVFNWDGSSWNQDQVLQLKNQSQGLINFGSDVDLDGSHAIISTSGYGIDQAYVFKKGSSGWVEEQKLSFPAVASYNGPERIKVAIDNQVAVVADVEAEVHVFRKVNGTWSSEGALAGDSSKGFGQSVDIYNNQILIGEPKSKSSAGAAHLFKPSKGSWFSAKTFRAPGEQRGQQCGQSVSIKGPLVVIGCPFPSQVGATYVYKNVDSNWSLASKLTSSQAQSGAEFGSSVGASAKHVVVGAVKGDGEETRSGWSSVFTLEN